MKRLVVLSDGTWKSAHDPRTGPPSNVVLLSRLIPPVGADGVPQIVCYDPGIGTGAGILERIKGGATGRGLDLNIAECYRFLVQHYAPGDKLYFFGFSRGAYTVRCLGGLVRKCGILHHRNILKVLEAIDLYRGPDHPDSEAAREFRRAQSHDGCVIEMIGVFDTVGALGIPAAFGLRWLHDSRRFHDNELSTIVRLGVQALAIDERRRQFQPVPWDGAKAEQKARERKLDHRVIQQWFAGCHSDIGGGLEQAGLSNIALRWIAEHATQSGLSLDLDFLDQTEWRGDPLAPVNESRRGLYRLWPGKPRTPSRADLHASVQSRLEGLADYHPRILG